MTTKLLNNSAIPIKKQKPYIIFKESNSRLKPGTFCKFNLKKEGGNWLLENYSTAQGTEQGSQTRIYDFLVRTVEKNARPMCLCYSVPQVSFVLHCWVKQRTFRFEKAARRQRKIYLMLPCYTHACPVASRIYWITSSSSRYAWYELLMNQLGRKMSLTQGIETHVSLSE